MTWTSGQAARTGGPVHGQARAVRVLHVIQRLDVGGLENGLVNLINHSPARGLEHAIVCLTTATRFRERLLDRNVPIVELGRRPGWDLSWYPRLWRVVRALAPDIVHTRNIGTIEAAPIARLARTPVCIHGEHGWDVFDLRGTRAKYRLYRRLASPCIDRFVTVSRHLERWLTEAVGIAPGKIEQIYNGVDTERFTPGAAHCEASPFGPRPGPLLVVGTVGRLQAVKDQVTLARAFVRCMSIDREAKQWLRLAIVGDGPLRAQVEAILAAAGLSSLAWLPGARDDIAGVLRGFDVFVLPSLNEGISNTILEAMASGLPVAATAVGGNPELVAAGETGLLFPAEDVEALAAILLRFMHDRQLASAQGAAARRRAVEQFSLHTMVQRYADLYHRLVEQGSTMMTRVES